MMAAAVISDCCLATVWTVYCVSVDVKRRLLIRVKLQEMSASSQNDNGTNEASCRTDVMFIKVIICCLVSFVQFEAQWGRLDLVPITDWK